MKCLISTTLLLALLAAVAMPAVAADAANPAAKGKIRVLLTFGGHGFEEEPFFAMFDAMPDVRYTKAPLPQSADLLKPGLEKDYDVIVMYDMVGGISPEQQKAFVALLKKGIGVVSLHHNMGAHSDWGEFRKIIGGKFILKPCEIDGQQYAVSGWSHDEDMKVTVADKEHPITKGVGDFEIHDETYKGYYTAPDVKVLLKTDHPKNDPELAWVKDYGKSRVLYLMLGHDSKAWANPSFVKILTQGIDWAAGR
ncbi:MAG: ThuA domain-containing protein [Pirellulales bacterium]|nr:ThuA domain-containing protein [Pirellulales bacterium]